MLNGYPGLNSHLGTSRINEWYRLQDAKTREAIEDLYYLRDMRQSSPDFWRGIWDQFAPEIYRHGTEVTWKHGRQEWAPYKVAGVGWSGEGKGLRVALVVLQDSTGVAWSAFPEDVTPSKP